MQKVIFYGPRASALNTHTTIIATAAVAMSPKGASTEFLLPELMRPIGPTTVHRLRRPISHTTERGAEQHHRHRGQYDTDAGGTGGAIGHRSRRLESIVRNVAADAKQKAYGVGRSLLLDAVASEGRVTVRPALVPRPALKILPPPLPYWTVLWKTMMTILLSG